MWNKPPKVWTTHFKINAQQYKAENWLLHLCFMPSCNHPWKNLDITVIRKVTQLGGENGQFQQNKASNVELRMKSLQLRMKILQNEITRTQTNFSTNFGGKQSFILLPERLHCCCIYFHCCYVYNYYSYSRTLCIKCWDLIKYPYFVKKAIGGERGSNQPSRW